MPLHVMRLLAALAWHWVYCTVGCVKSVDSCYAVQMEGPAGGVCIAAEAVSLTKALRPLSFPMLCLQPQTDTVYPKGAG